MLLSVAPKPFCESRACSTLLFLFLYCLIGCKHSSSPNLNSSISAGWVQGASIECSIETASHANRCTVRDRDRTLLASGLFILNDEGREATTAELKYKGYRGDKIYIQNDRFLYSVLPPDEASAVIDSKLELLAGHGVMSTLNCGRIAASQNRGPATECALQALIKKKPFHVRFDLQGWEGVYYLGLAGDHSQNLYAVEDASMLGDAPQIPGSRIAATPCPKPIKPRISPGGILTCLPTNP